MTSYRSLTDFELAGLLKTGEEKAFREIYERHWKKSYLAARRRLNDDDIAEEVVQDIFCKLWRRRETFVLSKGFDNYFAIAIKFEVINQMAKKARHTTFEKTSAATYSEADNSTIEDLDLKELKTQLQEAIDALPDKCRMVFKLKYEQDYTQQQIAAEMEISEKTVEAHLSKARKTLKSTFQGMLSLLICFL